MNDRHPQARPLLVGLFVAICVAVAAPSFAGAEPSATEILQARPLAPTDRNLFSTAIYPETSPMAPPAGSEPTQQQVSAMLNGYLQDEFPGDIASQNAAKAIYNSPAALSKIPSPSLRAAMATLKGTFAEPAIGFILNAQTSSGNPKVTTIKFVPPNQTPDPVRAVAGVYGAGSADSQQIEIRFNNRYQAEDPFLFTHVMAHEPLHADSQVANYEEVISLALDNLLYDDQLSRHANLARGGTELARRSNSNGLALMNSGESSRLGLYATNRGTQIFPGSTTQTFTSWWDQFDQLPNLNSTLGNSLLSSYLANIHTGVGPPCSGTIFSKALLDCIDAEGNGGLSSAELIAAAEALRLDTDVERSRTVSIAYRRGAFKGKLSSPQRPCAASQQVTLFKQKPGPDAKVGSDRTGSSGDYSIGKRNAKGKHYASVKRTTVPGIGVCLAAKSKTVNR